MLLELVLCPTCQNSDIVRHSLSGEGKPRYKCRNSECQRCTFMLNYTYRGRLPEVKQPYTDGWGAYTRHLHLAEHTVDKRNTQRIERKHLTMRTRITRLVRKTICFSKSIMMHDIVIGLFINRLGFCCVV